MAVCIPPVNNAQATSTAELRLHAALGAQLADDYLVMHSIAWISRPKGQGPRDGEADFLICHPSRGLLVVEIKGGRIAQIGCAHVCTPVTNAHLVCRLLLEKTPTTYS